MYYFPPFSNDYHYTLGSLVNRKMHVLLIYEHQCNCIAKET